MGNSELNRFLLDMTYDNKAILTRKGETIENQFIRQGRNQPDEFVVIERQKRSLSTNTTDITVTAANDNRIFPGALLLADQQLLDNNPTLVALDRAPITLSIDLPGLAPQESSIQIEHPENSSVREGINTLLANWNKTEQSHRISARMQYEQITAQSMEQLKVKFGADFEKTGNQLDIDFDSIHSGEKQVQIINFKQIYYTVSMNAVKNPADVFADTVTIDDLKDRRVSNEAPLVYISNVAYGRQIYLKLETTSKSHEVQAAFDALVKGVSTSPKTNWKQILENTQVTAVILGGDPKLGSQVTTGNIDMIQHFIEEGSQFNQNNPAVPISYTTTFLRDNVTATFQNSTDYIETKLTSYKDSSLQLDHSGAYVAQFYITWDEVSYDNKGNEVLTPKSWEMNGNDLTAHFTSVLHLKGNTRHLNILIRECTGLAWEWWRTVYDKKDLPLVKKRSISIWGTTLYPQVSETLENE